MAVAIKNQIKFYFCVMCKRVRTKHDFYGTMRSKCKNCVKNDLRHKYCLEENKQRILKYNRKQRLKLENKLRSRWHNMICRCYCKTDKSYARYGGRGIAVCAAWRAKKTGYKTYKTWFEAQSGADTADLQVDRTDNDGNYCPENCRLVTCAVNSRNRTGILLNFKKAVLIRKQHKQGIPMSILAKKFNVGYFVITQIIYNKNWVREA